MGVSYKTAFRWWKAGTLDAYQVETGTIIVRDDTPLPDTASGITLYARVSTAGQKADVDRQGERLKTSAASKGSQVTKVTQEIASGMNDTRPKLLKIVPDKSIGVIVVEHQDRLTRFGANYIEQFMQMQGRRIEVMFPRDTNHDLVDDFIAVITSMASRMYGRRHSKERAEKIQKCVEQVMKQERTSDENNERLQNRT